MKKLFNLIAKLILLLPLVLLDSCYDEPVATTDEKKLILDAKMYFESEIVSLQNETKGEKNYRASLEKNPDWNSARVKQLSVGEAVVVPLTFSENLYVKRGDNESALSINDISYLLLYKGMDKEMHTEVVISVPDIDYMNSSGSKKPFSGTVIVEDWKGDFVKGYKYADREIRALSHPLANASSAKVSCITVDWYSCVSNGDGGMMTCTYDYTETVCEGNGEGPGGSGSGNGGGGTGGGDYGDGGNSGGETENSDITLEEDIDYTCPANFTFVSVTTNNLWQEASMSNIYCELIYWVGNTGERVIRRVEIPQLYFGLPYYNVDGSLVYTPEQAAVISTNAFNQAEYDMRMYFKDNPSFTSYQLQQYWIERAQHYMSIESLSRGRVDRTGSINPSSAVPIRAYDPC